MLKAKCLLTIQREMLSNQLDIREQFREKDLPGVIHHEIVDSEIAFKAS